MGIAALAFGALTYAIHDTTLLATVLGLIAGYALVISLTSLITRRYIARALGERAGPIAETITREDGTKYIQTTPEFDQPLQWQEAVDKGIIGRWAKMGAWWHTDENGEYGYIQESR